MLLDFHETQDRNRNSDVIPVWNDDSAICRVLHTDSQRWCSCGGDSLRGEGAGAWWCAIGQFILSALVGQGGFQEICLSVCVCG